MAHVYVDSTATGGAGTGADWANAYLSINAAIAGSAVAGNTYWVAHDHNGTLGGVLGAYTSPGTAATPCTFVCVNKAGSVPPVANDIRATAVETNTGAFDMRFMGHAYWEGITFNCATGNVNQTLAFGYSATSALYFKNCNFNNLATGASINTHSIGPSAGAVGNKVMWDNCTVRFGAVTQRMVVFTTNFTWRNTATAINNAGSIPTTLFTGGTAPAMAFIEGVDLREVVSGKTLVGAITGPHKYFFKDCRLGSTTTIMTAQTVVSGAEVVLLRCDSGATNYRVEKHNYAGSQVIATDNVRVGGASDGTTAYSIKITPTANAELYMPFECLPIVAWNDNVTSTVTVTVYGFRDNAAVPTNAEIWMDVEYLGDAAYPQGIQVSTGPTTLSSLHSPSNTTADTSTWSGGDTTTPFKMVASLTGPVPLQKGPITIRIKVAAVTGVFYIDGKAILS